MLTDTWAIQTHQLTKIFQKRGGWRFWRPGQPFTAVDRVTLQVGRGELFGLLGPNGAGKTTLVKMICTLVWPTSGEASVLGFPISAGQEIRRRVGLTVTDERSFYWRLTGRQNLRFFAALHGLFGSTAEKRLNYLLDIVDLTAAADQLFSDYSSGMKQRLAIARSLLADPELLVLDEPTRSLDPVATERLHQLILTLMAERPMTVFLITHDLAEAEKLCHRVAIMHRGQILAQDRPLEIRRRLAPQLHYVVHLADGDGQAIPALSRLLDGDLTIIQTPGGIEINFKALENSPRLDEVLKQIYLNGLAVRTVETSAPSLEEAFQRLVGEGSLTVPG